MTRATMRNKDLWIQTKLRWMGLCLFHSHSSSQASQKETKATSQRMSKEMSISNGYLPSKKFSSSDREFLTNKEEIKSRIYIVAENFYRAAGHNKIDD